MASLLIPAGVANAVDISTGPGNGTVFEDGVNRPAGWVGQSVSWRDPGDLDEHYVLDGETFQAAPVTDPVSLDVFASTDSVPAFGTTVEYIVRLRRAVDYRPQPVLAPDYLGKTRENFRGSVDLRQLLDNVEPTDLSSIKPSGNSWDGLDVAYRNGNLSFAGAFPGNADTLEFAFAVKYVGRGDTNMDIQAAAVFTDTPAQAEARNGVVVRVAEPPLELVKSASTAQVTAKGEQITYTVTVKRPAGNSLVGYEFTDDLTAVEDDIEPMKDADVVVSGDDPALIPSVSGGSINYRLFFRSPPGIEATQTLSYTVTYAGGGDGVLTNVACALPIWSAANRMIVPAISVEIDAPQPVCDTVTTLALTDGEGANAGADAGSTPDAGSEGSAAAGADSDAGSGAADEAGANASSGANSDANPDADADTGVNAGADTEGGQGATAGANASENADATAGEPAVDPEEQPTPEEESEASASIVPAEPEGGRLPDQISVGGVSKELANTGAAAAPWLLGAGAAIALGAGATVAARRQRQH